MTEALEEFHRPPRSATAVAEAHGCAVQSCAVPCSPGHVACRRHWRQVPQKLRDPLIALFQRRLTNAVAFEQAQRRAAALVAHYAGLLDP